MLKRALDCGPRKKITVVEYSDEGEVPIKAHSVGQRYLSIFGRDVGWTTAGFEGWLDQFERALSQ